jgi:hypothetical protein
MGIVLVVKDDGRERLIDLEAALVLDEAQLLELVHEEVHARARVPIISVTVS